MWRRTRVVVAWVCAGAAVAAAASASPRVGAAAAPSRIAVRGPDRGTVVPAVVAAASGRPPSRLERTYRWDGLRVPVGACGVVSGGRRLIVPCNAVPAGRSGAGGAARRGGALALAALIAGGAGALRLRRGRRMDAAATE